MNTLSFGHISYDTGCEKFYFLDLTSTKTATAPIIPPKTSNTCNGNDPVAVTVPEGACVETNASSLLPDFCILANPAICS